MQGLSRLMVLIALVVSLGLSSDYLLAQDTVPEIKESARRYYYGDGVAQNLPRALALYLQAAKLGDAESTYIAGGMYFKGFGTEVDYSKAFALLYQAAEEGKSTPESQKILAQAFLLGQEVPQNFQEAVKWFDMAAREGDSEAQNELAFMYYTGSGVDQDFSKAYNLFIQASKQGYSLAQYNLGIMFYSGQGVPKADPVASYAWFSIAEVYGHPQAAQAKRFLQTILSPDELLDGQRRAEQLFSTMEASP